MLFGIDNVIESEKERNLYYKIFAGYIFNEMIDGWENRLNNFWKILREGKKPRKWNKTINIKALSKNTHVSFDNHEYLAYKDRKNRRGEFADILLFDKENSVLISIEVKFHSKLLYAKDVELNYKRLRSIAASLDINTVLLCVLIKEDYWKRLLNYWESQKGMPKEKQCFYYNWNENVNGPIIISWEDMLQLIKDTPVYSYLKRQLLCKKPWYFSRNKKDINRIEINI